MRRTDLEITDRRAIQAVIAACSCCRLGFQDGNQVYIVPLNFGYAEQDGRDLFYFHSAQEGHKIDLIRKNPHVGFEMDTGYQLHSAEIACGYSNAYRSIIGSGHVSFVENPKEKQIAMQSIMYHTSGRTEWSFPAGSLDRVCLIKLTADTLSCKEHL